MWSVFFQARLQLQVFVPEIHEIYLSDIYIYFTRNLLHNYQLRKRLNQKTLQAIILMKHIQMSQLP